MKDRPEIKEIMDIALRTGKILLTSGAEIYRVEDTIARVCDSYGVKCENFVLPTGIFVSIKMANGDSVSEIMRIRGRNVNLHKIELVNTFSRRLREEPLPYETANKILSEIENTPQFKMHIRILAAGVWAFVFTLLFRGTFSEGLVAAIIGMLVYLIKSKISEIGFYEFLEFCVSGMNTALMSLLAVKLFPQMNVYKIIIGAIVIFAPGVAITNSINDALRGDIVSSLAGMGETVLVVTALGLGVGIALIAGL
ncbi:MAG TPA: threonine/serine exporter family protein [Clostridiaceae bacterium]|nr:threonine/serine exporter family protein [Clostridiaceae bacterium]